MANKKTNDMVDDLYKELRHCNFIYSGRPHQIRESGFTFIRRANKKIQPKLFNALVEWMEHNCPRSPVTQELKDKGVECMNSH